MLRVREAEPVAAPTSQRPRANLPPPGNSSLLHLINALCGTSPSISVSYIQDFAFVRLFYCVTKMPISRSIGNIQNCHISDENLEKISVGYKWLPPTGDDLWRA